jgi:hypothetical protein
MHIVLWTPTGTHVFVPGGAMALLLSAGSLFAGVNAKNFEPVPKTQNRTGLCARRPVGMIQPIVIYRLQTGNSRKIKNK